MSESEEYLESVLATIIDDNKENKEGKVRIRVVNLTYDQIFKDKPWRKKNYWKFGTMSKFFRTCKKFVFHRVGPGRHLVSVSESFEYKKVDLNQPTKFGGKPKAVRKVTPKKTNIRKKEIKVKKIEKDSPSTVGDRKKFYEEKGGKMHEEENEVLKKQVESLEKQVNIREKTIQKQEKELVTLKMKLEEKNQDLKQIQHEIKLLRKEDKGYVNDEMSDDESDLSDDEDDLLLEEIEFSDLFRKKNCELLNPKKISEIEKGANNAFKIKCPTAVEIAVIIDDSQWHSMRSDDGQFFEGDVKIEKYSSFIDVLAKFELDGKFECIVTISIGD